MKFLHNSYRAYSGRYARYIEHPARYRGILLMVAFPKRLFCVGLRQMAKNFYHIVTGFTIFKNKQKIIKEVKKIHSDECPIIAFSHIDGNKEFLKWIKESTG